MTLLPMRQSGRAYLPGLEIPMVVSWRSVMDWYLVFTPVMTALCTALGPDHEYEILDIPIQRRADITAN
jgi:hypothetical protein